ncbi:DUF4342 domain-containing protein [Sphingobacterium alkalisoli]|uniref:DUF4342 domain-containing protein n=1 Tax=Sphingobacterium alkalisoli TaxID=1874115 RepID=A0A4U0GVN9_9SPHI|nr:DUF4342 domain-containing protein [Sphingobacterium alkalisoli]TJY62644.1 DUF4342 domain-containing protein [Sphingobacterium alkalisoli]GGH27966.1 hypothetical protein GCM10011418_38260 [Sphingobacterium alkalisoli]
MSFKESFNVNGENLLKKIKEIIAEGNVRKIIISDKAGKEILSFPVTIGVVGVVLLPIFAAVGALAALLTECTITVERSDSSKEHDQNDTPPPTENPNTPTDI